jgi:tRNA-specific 2-thiouridylase
VRQVEFIREYWSDVFAPSMAAYEAGHTPNPDVMCNREIKFKRFLHLCQSRFQADYIATGNCRPPSLPAHDLTLGAEGDSCSNPRPSNRRSLRSRVAAARW